MTLQQMDAEINLLRDKDLTENGGPAIPAMRVDTHGGSVRRTRMQEETMEWTLSRIRGSASESRYR